MIIRKQVGYNEAIRLNYLSINTLIMIAKVKYVLIFNVNLIYTQ